MKSPSVLLARYTLSYQFEIRVAPVPRFFTLYEKLIFSPEKAIVGRTIEVGLRSGGGVRAILTVELLLAVLFSSDVSLSWLFPFGKTKT